MKRRALRLAAVAGVLLVAALAAGFARGKADLPMRGKAVILHSNDVHGAIEGYACIAQLKKDFEAKGAAVILADAGDFMQGTPYVSASRGADAVTMMNAAGYDVAALGNHEFDYGVERQREVLAKADFSVLCADVFDAEGAAPYPPTKVIKAGAVKVGFIGVTTPESRTSVNPALIKDLRFAEGEEFYALIQEKIDALKGNGADVVVALAHLGVASQSAPYRSTDLYAAASGLDFIIDGHSHTVMTAGEGGEPIQSTGTEFAYIGVVVIDGASKRIEENYLLPVKTAGEDGSIIQNIESDPQCAGGRAKDHWPR